MNEAIAKETKMLQIASLGALHEYEYTMCNVFQIIHIL